MGRKSARRARIAKADRAELVEIATSRLLLRKRRQLQRDAERVVDEDPREKMMTLSHASRNRRKPQMLDACCNCVRSRPA